MIGTPGDAVSASELTRKRGSVDGGARQHGRRDAVMHQAAEIMPAERRQRGAIDRRKEIVAAAGVDQRLMQVPHSIVAFERRARHEGGKIAVAAAGLPSRCGTTPDCRRRCASRGARCIRPDRAPFVLDRAQGGRASPARPRLRQRRIRSMLDGMEREAGLGRIRADGAALEAGRPTCSSVRCSSARLSGCHSTSRPIWLRMPSVRRGDLVFSIGAARK